MRKLLVFLLSMRNNGKLWHYKICCDYIKNAWLKSTKFPSVSDLIGIHFITVHSGIVLTITDRIGYIIFLLAYISQELDKMHKIWLCLTKAWCWTINITSIFSRCLIFPHSILLLKIFFVKQIFEKWSASTEKMHRVHGIDETRTEQQ